MKAESPSYPTIFNYFFRLFWVLHPFRHLPCLWWIILDHKVPDEIFFFVLINWFLILRHLLRTSASFFFHISVENEFGNSDSLLPQSFFLSFQKFLLLYSQTQSSENNIWRKKKLICESGIDFVMFYLESSTCKNAASCHARLVVPIAIVINSIRNV